VSDVTDRTDGTGCSCSTREPGGWSRRDFLRRSAAVGAGVAVASAVPALAEVTTRVAYADAGYSGDVLVVLSLRGGFDGLNVVVPHGDPAYATARPGIRIPTASLVAGDSMFGLHPALAPLVPLWTAGKLGAVHAVGQSSPSRSHFQAMEEMERAAPGTSLRTGWLDRVLGVRGTGTVFQAVQLGPGLGSPALAGPAPELVLGDVDSFRINGGWNDTERQRWITALRAMHVGTRPALAAPAAATLAAVETCEQLKTAGYTPANGAVYPAKSELAAALRDLARLIKAGVGLQSACIDYGDWDMHAGEGSVGSGWLVDKLTELAGALKAFATDLGPALDGVTLVTLSEFGRRVEENGSHGTDHGHGNAVLMLGGGVVGGRVHGSWPGLAPANLVDGDLAGTTDYRAVLAEILRKRCGAGSLSTVFPGLPTTELGVVRQR
jgi:uncharacterized protein (DUF1501 family)